jgi:hypothetical protein
LALRQIVDRQALGCVMTALPVSLDEFDYPCRPGTLDPEIRSLNK